MNLKIGEACDNYEKDADKHKANTNEVSACAKYTRMIFIGIVHFLERTL